jgi:hypothetical protein
MALGVNVVAQVILFRLRRGAQFTRSIVEGGWIGAMVGLGVGLVCTSRVPAGQLLSSLAASAFTYLALSYCYYHFVQLGQTSIRIRIYMEIASSPQGLTIEELAGRYDGNVLLQMRLKRLIESRDITQREGRFFVGRSRFVRVAAMIYAARRLVLGGKVDRDNGCPPLRSQD